MTTSSFTSSLMGLGAPSELAKYIEEKFLNITDVEMTNLVNIGTLTAPYSGINYSTYSSATCKTRHVASVACYDLRLIYNSMLIATVAGTPEVKFGNDFEIKCSVELGGGTLVPVFFNGARLKLMKPGSVAISEPVGIRLAAGEVFWVRTYFNRIASTSYTDGTGQAGFLASNQTNLCSNVTLRGTLFSGTEGASFSSSTGVDPFLQDKTDSSTIAASNNQGYAPIAIVGRVETTQAKSVIVIGDSISAGSGDFTPGSPTNSNFDIYSGRGYWPRAFRDSYAITQLACGGEQTVDFIGNTKSFYRYALADYGSTAILALGTNDIMTGGLTAAQLKAKILLLIEKIAPKVSKILVGTMIPRTTSTNGWLTTAGQTTVMTNSFNSVRVEVNNWIRELGTGHPYIEIADLVESARDSGLWKAPGTALDSGTATGGSTTTIVDSSKSWTTNQWMGYVAAASSSSGQAGVITANTSNTLTLTVTSGALSPGVSAGNTYTIHAAYTLDGTHPSAYGHAQMAANVVLTGID